MNPDGRFKVAVYIKETIARKRYQDFEVACVEAVWLSVQSIHRKIFGVCYC